MKKILRASVPILVVVLALVWWRLTHPPLTDEQQIQAALDGVATQVSNKSAGGILNHLSKDFDFGGLKKKDIRPQLVGGLLQFAVVNMKVAPAQIRVDGDTATSTGRYDLGLKREFTSPEEKSSSEFSLKWKKEDGQWKIFNADGNKIPPGLMGG